MRSKNVPIGRRAILATLITTLLLPSAWAATEKLVHNFGSGTDGTIPYSALISDGAGNFYGTTASGGTNNAGTVFELSPNGSGGWTEKKLHNFGNGTDGVSPYAGLVMDAAGNLYGTTAYGGNYNAGTAFELSPNGSGGWLEKKIRNFGANATDPMQPFGGLVFDGNGNLYGTAYFGGYYGYGVVFELTPAQGETWKQTKLHYFNANGTDGYGPNSTMVRDADGNLYGTTAYGGPNNSGTVFRLKASGGGFIYSVLQSFNYSGADGGVPIGGLVFDAAGNLYGTVNRGGAHNAGTVFELSHHGMGWMETVLRALGNSDTDAAIPLATLVVNGGNLYGTSFSGGTNNAGTVFVVMLGQDGRWTDQVLYSFGNGMDGALPYAPLIMDSSGNFYGTTSGGGSHSDGIVFKFTP